MLCDELKKQKYCQKLAFGDEVYLAEQVDAAIDELNQTIDKLVGVKKSAEQILQNLFDCGLIKEWFYNGTFHAVLKADDPHLKIAGLKQMLEDAKASHYAEMVDAGMRERRLRRALYKACANWALSTLAWLDCIDQGEPRKWSEMERKCRAKAEEYK